MFGTSQLTTIIGERINPTGRPQLADELRRGIIDKALADARAQAEAGADYIDVNVGAPGIDETKLLPLLVKAVAAETGLPACIDSADPEALASTIRQYGDNRAVINSVTADDESMDSILPLVAEAGCFVIGMTKSRKGIPATPEERISLAECILERATGFGIARDQVLIDCLTIPAATAAGSGTTTLDSIERIKANLGCPVVLGASNISFGMPERGVINAAFLAMAVRAGLAAAIINPLEPGLVFSIRAADFLLGKDRMGRGYLKYYRAGKE